MPATRLLALASVYFACNALGGVAVLATCDDYDRAYDLHKKLELKHDQATRIVAISTRKGRTFRVTTLPGDEDAARTALERASEFGINDAWYWSEPKTVTETPNGGATMDLFLGPTFIWGARSERETVQELTAFFTRDPRQGGLGRYVDVSFLDVSYADSKEKDNVEIEALDKVPNANGEMTSSEMQGRRVISRINLGLPFRLESCKCALDPGVGLTVFQDVAGDDDGYTEIGGRGFLGIAFGDVFNGYEGSISAGLSYDEFWEGWGDNTEPWRVYVKGSLTSRRLEATGTAIGVRLMYDRPRQGRGPSDLRVSVHLRQSIKDLQKFVPGG